MAVQDAAGRRLLLGVLGLVGQLGLESAVLNIQATLGHNFWASHETFPDR